MLTTISLKPMIKYMGKKQQSGFTIVEMMVVIFVIATLATLVVMSAGDSRARGRDTERTSDIDTLHSRLEEYFNDNGGYPNTFTAATFPSINDEALVDPNGNSIVIGAAAASQYDALAVTNPTNVGANYLYVPYPTGCTAITCTGYILKTFIEKPSDRLPNPYTKSGLSNN